MEADRPAWNFFEDILPPEVTMGVFSFLELEDVVYVALVCKTWNTYFDTKDIWKQIYEKNFGQRDESAVNPNQNLRWKRFYKRAISIKNGKGRSNYFLKSSFDAINRDFTKAQRTFRCNTYSSDQLVLANRYHVILTYVYAACIDLRLVAKRVQVKHNPGTLYNFSIENVGAINSSIKTYSDPKPPKDDIYTVPRINIYATQGFRLNGQGDYLHKEQSTGRFGIWNAEKQIIGQGKTSDTILMLTPPVQSSYAWSINSKFAMYNNRQMKCFEVYIMDLSKKCTHCCTATLKNGYYAPEVFPNPCPGLNRSPNCSIIEKLDGPFDWMYASQCNPNILIMAYYNRIVIWRHGEPSIEVKLPEVRTFSNCGEHFVEGKGHWFTYSITYSPAKSKTTFMDLNNVSNKIDMPFLSKYLFVPKKSKVVCVLKDKIIAYDLDQKTWLSKIQVPKPVRAMTFSKSTAILFVATEDNVYAYQWETADLLGVVEHEVRSVNAIHFMLDQVLIVCGQEQNDYLKIKTKLDF